MEIDVNATILPDGQKIWRVFPGKSYRLLESFIEQNAFFLEQPDIELNIDTLENDENLAAKVFTADLIASDRRKNGNNSKFYPSWTDYQNTTPDSDLNRKVNATLDFYLEAKPGDLIIAPDHKSRNNVFIGSISKDKRTTKQILGGGKYEGLSFIGREAKWITRVDDSSLSPRLSRALRHEHAFTEIAAGLYNEVYSLAYGNFIGNGVYSSVVLNGNDDFRDIDSTLIGVIFKLAAQCCKAYDEGVEKVDLGSLIDFIIDEPALEYACFLSAEHHSPGYRRYVGTKATALVAVSVMAGMLTLANQPNAAEFKNALNNINLVNSAGGNKIKCPPELEGPAELFFQSINGDKLRKACHTLAETTDRAKLNMRSKGKGQEN